MVPDVPNWFFTVCGFIGFILCMIPLPWHLQASNTGTCLYMIWTGLGCLIFTINSLVWYSDVIVRAPVWCDITSKLIVGLTAAIPASSLCINRRLYQIASVQSVTRTHAQRRRDIMIDLAIGLGIPFLVMILYFVVQPFRFVIVEEVGCYPYLWNTALTYVLVSAWPIAIGLVSAFYCIRTIRELSIRRAQFKEFLSTNKDMSSSRYFRLMALAGTDIACTIPLGTLVIADNLRLGPVQPYVSWSYVHASIGEIVQMPSVVWRQDQMQVVGFELNRFFLVFCAIVFFAFFGFADEAKKNYRLAYMSVAKRIGLSTGSTSATGTWTANGSSPDTSYSNPSGLMPVFITHQAEKKRDSIASYSSRMSLPDYGGALADVKKEAFSPTATSSGSMSKESLPRLPVDLDCVPLPRLPEMSLDPSTPPRYAPDAPSAV